MVCESSSFYTCFTLITGITTYKHPHSTTFSLSPSHTHYFTYWLPSAILWLYKLQQTCFDDLTQLTQDWIHYPHYKQNNFSKSVKLFKIQHTTEHPSLISSITGITYVTVSAVPVLHLVGRSGYGYFCSAFVNWVTRAGLLKKKQLLGFHSTLTKFLPIWPSVVGFNLMNHRSGYVISLNQKQPIGIVDYGLPSNDDATHPNRIVPHNRQRIQLAAAPPRKVCNKAKMLNR